MLVVTRHPRTCESEHEQHPHHHVVESSTLNWISVPVLNFVPNVDELAADTANEARATTKKHTRIVRLLVTPLTSVLADHYTPTDRLGSTLARPAARNTRGGVRRRAPQYRVSGGEGLGRQASAEHRRGMAKDPGLEKLSIYIPQKKMGEKPVERLIKLGQRRDRSVNYLVVEAILQYVQREENGN